MQNSPKMVRTRFAPSPTGFLHVGGLRTALYSFLFAKKHNGSFILRIEDTDQTRQVDQAVENLIQSLQWAGIQYDEGPLIGGAYGPYIQSERLKIYQEYAQKLLISGHAYYCFCSPERLEQVRQRKIAAKLPPAYDQHCRYVTIEQAKERIAKNEPAVIRMKVPLEGELSFEDLVRGQVVINFKNVDDQILLKSDGFPTYHLAVVVDDHLMQISHVIRGEEWLSSTPKHLLLYKYFNWPAPSFAHIPLLLNPDKSKLSKRQGDVAVEDYVRKGFISEALVNFVALLGWNPGTTQEIFSLKELISEFSLERVGKSGAIFNIEKLRWMNHKWLNSFPSQQLGSLILPCLAEAYPAASNLSTQQLEQIVLLIQKDLVTLQDSVSLTRFYFERPNVAVDTIHKLDLLSQAVAVIQDQLPVQDGKSFLAAVKTSAKTAQLPLPKLFPVLRVALTGNLEGFGICELIDILGPEESTFRLSKTSSWIQH